MNHDISWPVAGSGYYSIAEYNARIVSAQACRAGIAAFWQKAAEAPTREDWERHAAAARDMEVFAPRVEAQARKLAQALGIPDAEFGRILTLDECRQLQAGRRAAASCRPAAVLPPASEGAD
ncbi:hypothetical protein [Chitinilyticum litopenaei]|uniref:hypothetical protein n=1 Tax=Chitinilyticum litopenaei TaxID=1121276 RepID=UPI0003F788CB|nr:hypothetical protein [Chitinilyticum litopenaei]